MSLLGSGLNMPGLDHTRYVPCISFMFSVFPTVLRSLSKVEEGQRNQMCTLKKCRPQE